MTAESRPPAFPIPEKAKKEIQTRTLTNEPAMIEFPRDSGQWAEYAPAERDAMRGLTREEMLLIHGGKVMDAEAYLYGD